MGATTTLVTVREFLELPEPEGQRMELMRDGVRTMLVCPGYVKTGFQKNVRSGQAPESVQKARRFAITPEQCAEAIRGGVEREARTVVTPRSGWVLVFAMRLFPSIVESRMASRQLGCTCEQVLVAPESEAE